MQYAAFKFGLAGQDDFHVKAKLIISAHNETHAKTIFAVNNVLYDYIQPVGNNVLLSIAEKNAISRYWNAKHYRENAA